MKNFKTIIATFATLAIFAAVAEAQPQRTYAKLPTAACTAGNIDYRLFVVTDAPNNYTCNTGGDGTTPAICWCVDGSFVAVVGGANLAAYVPVTKAGQQTITATGAGNDVSLVAADDVILTPTGSLTVTAADGAVAVTTSLAIDAAGGTDEIGISENVVSVSTGILFRIVPTAAPPAACAAGTEGGLYLDSDTHLLCVCNASGWVQVADGTTGCS